MNQQEHAGAYRAAIEAAMNELDFICQESERLKNRQYQLDDSGRSPETPDRLRRANGCGRSSSRFRFG